MIETLIIYFLVSVFAATIFYLVGGAIFNALKISLNNTFLKVFAHLLCGIIAAVFIYSIIITHFNTIMTGLLIPFGFILSANIKRDEKRESFLKTLFIDGKTILLCIVVLFLVCGYNLFFLWDANNHILVPPEIDRVFYARASDYLNYSRVESSYFDYFNTNSPCPYHYFELWLTAIIIRFPGLNTLLVQQVSLNGILFLVLYFGGLALVSSVKRVGIIDIVLCLFLPFFEGFKLPLFPIELYHRHDYFFFDNPFMRQKYCITAIIFIASFLLFLKQRINIALLILLFGCFLNISLVTTIPFVVIIMCLYLRTDNKYKIILASILTIIFCNVFYSLNNTTSFWKDSPSLFFMVKYTFSSLANFKTAFNNTSKTIIEIILIFFPFIFAFYFLWKKDKTIKRTLIQLTWFVVLLIIISTTLWSVFTLKSDSIQLFDNASIPAVSIYFFTIAILLISRLNSIKLYLIYIALGIWGLLCFKYTYNNLIDDKNKSSIIYSPEYLQTVKEKLLTLNNQGGHLTVFKGPYDNFRTKFHVYSYRPYLALIKNNVNITLLQSTDSIKHWDYPFYRPQEKIIESMQFFNRYIEKQKSTSKFKSEAESRIDYIKDNNLQFVIADKGAVVDSLLLSITDTIITDKKSEERFIILKK